MIFCMKINFLQANSIIITGRSQTWLKYPKKQVCNVLAISQKKGGREGGDEVVFLPVDKHQTFVQVDFINLGGRGQACPK